MEIEDVDMQHQKLVGRVNSLADAMADGKGKHILAGIIEELVGYTKVHFETEERILQLVTYPGLKHHQQEHADFVNKVSDFQHGFSRGQLGLTIEIMNYLCDWVRNHIKKTDKKYAQYIDENNLRP